MQSFFITPPLGLPHLVFRALERVSTQVVVVVAQPHMYAYTCAHASSVTEPKLHRLLPKHLPLHTEESLEKVHPMTNFTT